MKNVGHISVRMGRLLLGQLITDETYYDLLDTWPQVPTLSQLIVLMRPVTVFRLSEDSWEKVTNSPNTRRNQVLQEGCFLNKTVTRDS